MDEYETIRVNIVKAGHKDSKASGSLELQRRKLAQESDVCILLKQSGILLRQNYCTTNFVVKPLTLGMVN